MEHIAKVEIIHADPIDLFRWFRKEINMPVSEARELSRSKIIDFGGDIEKAYDFYVYIQTLRVSGARLIIDDSFDYRGAMGSFAISKEESNDIEKYYKEFDSDKK